MNPSPLPFALTVAATLSLALIGCGNKDRTVQDVSRIGLAEVAGVPVTEQQFRHWWEHQSPSSDTPQARDQVLDDLIHRETLLQRARAAGLHNDPVVREAIDSLLIARLNEVELQPVLAAIEVTEDEARASYEADRDTRFTEPAARRAAVLWFDTRGQDPLARRYQPRLEKVRAILTNDPATTPVAEGFGPIAVANSEHQATRFKGGDLGWIEAGPGQDRVRAAATEIADTLTAPGELSEVVVRDEGVFLVRLIATREPRTKPFAQVRPQIERTLLAGKRQAARARFETRMSEGVAVTRFPDHLRALSDLPLHDPESPRSFRPSLSELSARN